jgi:hypothetical protein
MTRSHVTALALLFLSLLGAGAARAADAPPQPPEGAASGGRRAGPPPEAIAACQGLKAGDAASFTGRRGETLAGTCQAGPDGQLALRPERGPKPPR